jgi:hypothetical protein
MNSSNAILATLVATKKVGRYWSVRVSLRSVEVDGGYLSFWIGSHSDYDTSIQQLNRCVPPPPNQISLHHPRQNNPRANHPNPVYPLTQKYSASVVGQINDLDSRVSPDERGVAHVTNARWDAVDAKAATDESG